MHFFLLHCLLLLSLLFLAARSAWTGWIDRMLAVVALFWGNIVVTCLVLSSAHGLGDRGWFFRISLLVAFGTWLAVNRLQAPAPVASASHNSLSIKLTLILGLTLLPIAWASFRIAATYEPNNYDSLAYHLPRVMFYLGQNTLGHFDTGNDRQIFFPFNYNLLQLFPLAYGTPLQTLNFLNLAAWAIAGLSVYHIGRLAGFSSNASLISAWFALTSTQILAQATATTNDLPAGAGLLVTLVFILRWRQSRLSRDALLAGLAAGLTAGTKLTIVFFGPGAALILVLLTYTHARQENWSEYFRGMRSWAFPGVLALALASPFAIINLAEKGVWVNNTYDYTLNRPFRLGCVVQTSEAFLLQIFAEPIHRFTFDLKFSEHLNTVSKQLFFRNWNDAWAFSPLYLFPPDLNEDHVFFGFAGPLILLCALWCLLRWRRPLPQLWLALLGLGWFAAYLSLNKWSLYNQRYFVLPILVLCPVLGILIDGAVERSLAWLVRRLILVLVGGAAIWLAGIYLFYNTSRPYYPLWREIHPPPALPSLPPLISQRLAAQSRINFDSTDGNERAFLFMTFGRNQRFTAHARTEAKAYNVYSLWGFVRKVIYNNIEQQSSYTIVKFPDKPTAGVEYLGTIGEGSPALDYYGLAPHPEQLHSSEGDRNVMVKLLYARREPARFSAMRIRIAGLNLPDHARLIVMVEYADRTTATIATFTSSGEVAAPVTKPFSRFIVSIEDVTTRRELGHADVPYLARTLPPDVEAPDDPNLLFTDELIKPRPEAHIPGEGLSIPEGPYPQWRLPLVRWAKTPIVRLVVPTTDDLKRIELSFSARLEVRDFAQMDVVFNGQIVQGLTLRGRANWWTHTYQFTPQPGENVIELRHVVVSPEIDWLDYLERNPDVKAYVLSQGIPLEEGARNHYEIFGRKENRVVQQKRRIETLANPEQLYFLFRSLHLTGYRTP